MMKLEIRSKDEPMTTLCIPFVISSTDDTLELPCPLIHVRSIYLTLDNESGKTDCRLLMRKSKRTQKIYNHTT